MSLSLKPWIRGLHWVLRYNKKGLLYHSYITSSQRSLNTSFSFHQKAPAEPDVDISKNPYFEKYIRKIQELQFTNPELYQQRLKDLEEKLKPKVEPPPKEVPKKETKPLQRKSVSKLSLNDIVKLDLLRERTPEEIEKIWMQYHSIKDCVYGVIKENDYDEVMAKSKLCPFFVYPVPRRDGYEFIYQQFSGNEVYYTPLSLLQRHKENAPPCLTLQHFTELKDEKGVVLMSGDYDDSYLDKTTALNLVRQLTMYYGQIAAERFTLVRLFNHIPEKFDINDLIKEYKGMKTFLESSITAT